jgi:hypothetical protein
LYKFLPSSRYLFHCFSLAPQSSSGNFDNITALLRNKSYLASKHIFVRAISVRQIYHWPGGLVRPVDPKQNAISAIAGDPGSILGPQGRVLHQGKHILVNAPTKRVAFVSKFLACCPKISTS